MELDEATIERNKLEALRIFGDLDKPIAPETLEKVARAMGRKYDVTISFRGGKACTNGNQIILPALPENMTKEDMIATRGYCDHEVGHVRHTDFQKKIEMIGSDAELHNVWNIIEDTVIEKKMSAEFPGARDNMNFLMNWLIGQGKIDLSHPLMWFFVEGRRRLAGYEFPPELDFAEGLKELFGEDVLDRLDRIDTTEEAVIFARDILKKYNEARAPMPTLEEKEGETGEEGEPGGPSDEDCDESDDSLEWSDDSSDDSDEDEGKDDAGDSTDKDKDGEDEVSSGEEESSESDDGSDGSEEDDSDGDDDSPESDDGSGEGSEGDEGDVPDGSQGEEEGFDERSETITGEADGSEEATSGRKSSHLPEVSDLEDPLEAMRKYLEGKSEEALDNGQYMVWSKDQDVLEPMSEASTTRGYEALKDKLGSLNVMKGRVQSLFLTRTNSRWLNDREEGKINSRALAKLKAGNRRVFREKYVSKDRDTAIGFLVDYSGSMCWGPLEAAMKATVCFLESLEGTKIKSEVLTFTTGGVTYEWGEARECLNLGEYGRIEALDMKIIKGFEEPYNARVKRRISNWRHQVNANNCDGDSVQIAVERLLRRPEHRKILFCLTDGLVGNHGNCERGRAYLKRVVKDALKSGVEIIGIGLNVRGLAAYYPEHIDLRSADDLALTLFTQLRKILKV